MIAQDTVSCVALGTGKALDNLDALEEKQEDKEMSQETYSCDIL